ncbi:MAG TPA: sulfotransferase [Rhodanobacteraceae bacterium]
MSETITRSPPLSSVAARLLRRAQQQSEAGDAQAAFAGMTHVLALAPNDPEALRWMGIAAQNVGDHGKAASSYRYALATLPDDANLHIGLGVALYRLGRVEDGMAHLHRACELAPDSANAWYNLAEALQPRAQTEAAIDALEKVLAIDPGHVPARLSLARAQASLGQVDVAVASLRDVLQREPRCADAWFALSNLKLPKFAADDVPRIEACLDDPGVGAGDRTQLRFVLARALEDQGDYERAWDVLQQANAERRREVKWDGAGEHRRVDAMLDAFKQPVASAANPQLGHEIVFIASLPRSGSTLVEQILASHPEVEGANEIRDVSNIINEETARVHGAFPLWVPAAGAADWQRMGRRYMERTARWRNRRPRMVDKNLLNWLLVGTELAMLPAARVVMVRRDPLETCLSCYRQYFAGEEGFNYDLDELADVCIDYWRLTRFWLEKFPGRIFDLEYEALVADPEGVTRRLLEFCDLLFDPACLEFYKNPRAVLSTPSAAQVRQPIRNDTARTKLYGAHLDTVRQRLRDAGLPVAD